ncbi:MAG: HAD family hydrolase [Phascolarctobacterium sp.]|nr:HAD family hydrolase [Candidatus Phascolarctobacterium caballi]
MSTQNKAILFDRDGTLNVDVDYLYRQEDFCWMPEAVNALLWLKQKGYELYVVTNQSGIARGYYTLEDMQRLHKYMNDELKKYGTEIKKFYFCPHLKDGKIKEFAVDCSCRKPKPGMILQCLQENNLLAENCVVIGDKQRDLGSAEQAGVKGYLYQGGSLLEFVKKIGL